MMNEPQKLQSFTNSENPTLVIQTLKGRRIGWPVSSITEWDFEPTVFVSDGRNQLTDTQLLKVTVGLRMLHITGIHLDRICNVFELGSGGILIEHGSHFRALAPENEPYIETIEIKDVDDEEPKNQNQTKPHVQLEDELNTDD